MCLPLPPLRYCSEERKDQEAKHKSEGPRDPAETNPSQAREEKTQRKVSYQSEPNGKASGGLAVAAFAEKHTLETF
jgi:hypothetical protein